MYKTDTFLAKLQDGGFGLYAGTETCNVYYLKFSPTQGLLSEFRLGT